MDVLGALVLRPVVIINRAKYLTPTEADIKNHPAAFFALLPLPLIPLILSSLSYLRNPQSDSAVPASWIVAISMYALLLIWLLGRHLQARHFTREARRHLQDVVALVGPISVSEGVYGQLDFRQVTTSISAIALRPTSTELRVYAPTSPPSVYALLQNRQLVRVELDASWQVRHAPATIVFLFADGFVARAELVGPFRGLLLPYRRTVTEIVFRLNSRLEMATRE